MKNRKAKPFFCVAVTACLAVSLSGCGEPSGGVYAETTVTVLPADAEIKVGPTNGGGSTKEPAEAGGIGSITGRVVFKGTAPQLAAVVAKGSAVKDAEVCSGEEIPNEKLQVDASGGVKNVYVYLAKKPRGYKDTPPSEPVVFDQKGCRFFPHCSIVRVGQTLLVKSDDPILHNTHTYPSKNDSFNESIAPKNRDGVPIVYESAEASPFAVKCDFHAWMTAYIFPVDHPWVALTNDKGEFEIKDLPAGKHSFKVWHPGASGGFVHRKFSITVKPDTAEKVEIPYDAGKFAG